MENGSEMKIDYFCGQIFFSKYVLEKLSNMVCERSSLCGLPIEGKLAKLDQVPPSADRFIDVTVSRNEMS